MTGFSVADCPVCIEPIIGLVATNVLFHCALCGWTWDHTPPRPEDDIRGLSDFTIGALRLATAAELARFGDPQPVELGPWMRDLTDRLSQPNGSG